MTLFTTGGFDLDAYLARVQFAEERSRPAPDLATLQRLALLHPGAIAFENLNPLLRRPVRLDIASIQEKLVHGGRGGWCFEHNLLLGTALTAIGFRVTGLSARVLWNVPLGVVRPRSHMVLHVVVDETPFIVDSGFGGPTPTAPLRLEPDREQATPHEPFRLVPDDGEYRAEMRLQDEWRALYTFDLQPQTRADYELPNWYLCTHPESHFLGALVAARVASGCRYALRNTDFAIHQRDGHTERRVLANGAELRRTLEVVFGINVPAESEVDDVFERLTSRILHS